MITNTISRLVRAYRVNVPIIPCYACGKSPVMHRVEWPFGKVSFNFGCPDMDCRANDRSPARDGWKQSRDGAAEYWNEHNKPL